MIVVDGAERVMAWVLSGAAYVYARAWCFRASGMGVRVIELDGGRHWFLLFSFLFFLFFSFSAFTLFSDS